MTYRTCIIRYLLTIINRIQCRIGGGKPICAVCQHFTITTIFDKARSAHNNNVVKVCYIQHDLYTSSRLAVVWLLLPSQEVAWIQRPPSCCAQQGGAVLRSSKAQQIGPQ